MKQFIFKNSIKHTLHLGFFCIIFNLGFVEVARACENSDPSCMEVIGKPIPRDKFIVPFMGGGGGGGGSLPGFGGGGGSPTPPPPPETRAECSKPILDNVKQCKKLFGGTGVVTVGFCSRLGAVFPSWGKSCIAAAALLTKDAFDWCTQQGKAQIKRECPP